MRFRLPYESIISLNKELKEHELFDQWYCKDIVGDEPSNINLLLLGVLHCMCRVWTLDDTDEDNGIPGEFNYLFITTFIEYGSTALYKNWTIDPTVNTEISHHEKLFQETGFNGCIGSTDITHIDLLACASCTHIRYKWYELNI